MRKTLINYNESDCREEVFRKFNYLYSLLSIEKGGKFNLKSRHSQVHVGLIRIGGWGKDYLTSEIVTEKNEV